MVPGVVIGAHHGGGDLEAPGDDGEDVEERGLGVGRQAEVLDVWEVRVVGVLLRGLAVAVAHLGRLRVVCHVSAILRREANESESAVVLGGKGGGGWISSASAFDGSLWSSGWEGV